MLLFQRIKYSFCSLFMVFPFSSFHCRQTVLVLSSLSIVPQLFFLAISLLCSVKCCSILHFPMVFMGTCFVLFCFCMSQDLCEWTFWWLTIFCIFKWGEWMDGWRAPKQFTMHREQSFSGRCMSQFRYGKAAQSGDCLFGVISFFHGIAFRILRRTLTSFQTVPGAVFRKK